MTTIEATRELLTSAVIPAYLERRGYGLTWRIADERFHCVPGIVTDRSGSPDDEVGVVGTFVLDQRGVILASISIANIGDLSANPGARFPLLRDGLHGRVEETSFVVAKDHLWAPSRGGRQIRVSNDQGLRYCLIRSGLRSVVLRDVADVVRAEFRGRRVVLTDSARFEALLALLIAESGLLLDTSHPLLNLVSNIS